jgi:hypothetical protein
MAIVTFDTTDPVSEAYALAEVLRAFLAEQPAPTPRAVKASFEYDGDGPLWAITTGPLLELVK